MRILLFSFIFSLTSLANQDQCDPSTFFYSSGGKGGGEKNEASLLRQVRNLCPGNMYYGKSSGIFTSENETSNSSNKDEFYSGLDGFLNPKLEEDETRPPLLKLHIAGHGTSIRNVDDDESKEEYIKAREQDILTRRRRLSDYEEKLTNQSDTEFLQITNETCLSGNALAQMIGIPLNEPYSNFDYAMYSTDNPDGNQDFPKARDINEMILDSGRTACGVASSTGHTNVIFPKKGALRSWRRNVSGNTMADTQDKFKRANKGRSPSPAETEHCALRNKNHLSAPVSSSTIFLEQLSHQIGRDKGIGSSQGSDFLISQENPDFSRSLHCPVETFQRFEQIENIQTRLLIQKKREALKANIDYLLKKDKKLRRLKTDGKIQDVVTEISKREITLAQK